MKSHPQQSEVAHNIQLWLKFLVGATVFLYVALAGVTVYAIDSSRNNKHALCEFRGDLAKRVETSRKFIDLNPKGIPGIPNSLIREQANNQERTVKALSSLHC